MAQFLAAHGWVPPDSLTIQLRERLPADFLIVAATHIYGCLFEILVVAPTAIYILHPRTWQGEIRATTQGAWTATKDADVTIQLPNPANEARQCQQALVSFLKDEFPALRLEVHQIVVLTMPDARAITEANVWPLVTTISNVEEAIVIPHPSAPQLGEEVREDLAIALRDRQLTHSQRASEPFIFRTGSRSVWTIRDAILHMDRHPSDGIYHLRNRTLLLWLSNEGANHVVKLAEAVMKAVSDDRAMLETFLVGTGLVARPLLAIRPGSIELGPVVSGNIASTVVRLEKKSGRGFLFGSLVACEPWLRVDPDHFDSTPVDVVITIDTGTLPIRAKPYTATVEIHSSASEAPLPLEVHVKVVGMPSHLERLFLRPLVCMALSGLVGATLGSLIGISAAGTPIGVGSSSFWMMTVGLLWMLAGAINGIYQPPDLPGRTLLWHWVRRFSLWAVALFVVTVGVVWGEQGVGGWLGLDDPNLSPTLVGAGGAALAIIPALFGKRQVTSSKPIEKRKKEQHPIRLPHVVAASLILLALLLITRLETVNVGESSRSVAMKSGEWLSEIETRFDRWTDELIVRFYDRRAPAQSQEQP